MSDQDGTTPTEEPQSTEQPTGIDLDVLAKKIAEIKTEEGEPKYASVEKAVDSIKYREEFVEQLKAENAAEREAREALEQRLAKLETTVSLEEKIAEKIASQQSQEERPSAVELDEQKLSELVAAQIAQMDTKKKREANSKKFVEAIASETDNVEKFIQDKATEVGIGVGTFNDLISQNYEAALKLVGVAPKAPEKTKPNLNTAGFQQKQEEKPKPVGTLFTKNKDRVSRAAELLDQLRADNQ
jgi:hypothetical protein